MTAFQIALWIVSVAMIVTGVVGTILPVVPGVALIFGGIALGAWGEGFVRISLATVIVEGVLAVTAFAADHLAAVLGAKRAGASRLAVVGAAVGVVAGIFAGFIGVFVFPFVGAVIGEFVAQRDLARAGRVGVATWLGFALGTAVKVAIVFAMLGVLVAALLA